MKKILVVLTGGTIGSYVQNQSVDVTEASAYQLISLYQKIYGDGDEFEVIQPFCVLSENMTPKIWAKLCSIMKNIPYEKYQGVIVTHGSDTLSYTSALLGMYLGNAAVPVVITAANYPLEDPRSNGLVNFRSAVELIRGQIAGGVFVVYQNHAGEIPVYLATRLVEADAYADQFRSFGKIPFGKMDEGQFIPYKSQINPSVEDLKNAKGILGKENLSFQNNILLIRSYPGLDYRWINLEQRPAAILHYLYHSATACTEKENYSFIEFLKKCKQKNIPVYTASYKNMKGRAYVTAKEIIKAGAIPLENISVEAAYMKLMLLHNLQGIDVGMKINENFFFERLPSPEFEQ